MRVLAIGRPIGTGAASGRRPAGTAGGDVHGGLGRAVEVVQRGRRAAGEAPGGGRRQRLAAADHLAQRRCSAAVRLGQERRQHRRYEVDGGDACRFDDLAPGRPDPGAPPGAAKTSRAPPQRPEELPHGHVEAVRRLLQHRVVGAQPVASLHPRDPVGDPTVVFITPLGRPVEPEV